MIHSAILALTVVATSYCDNGHTATGASTNVGIVAVDPRIIPLHSRLHLQLVDRRTHTGILGSMQHQFSNITYIAEDTGGDIKGHRMDIWMPRCQSAINWGRQTIRVTLDEKSSGHKAKRFIRFRVLKKKIPLAVMNHRQIDRFVRNSYFWLALQK